MSRPRRLPGCTYRGPGRYFLTFCTNDRHAAFCDGDVAAAVIAQFRRTAKKTEFALLAYCLMPDHAHLLVEGTSAAADLRSFAARAKQTTGQTYARRARRLLWQERYYERVLRADEDARAVARYILENPVRAGLRTPAEYPHLGSDVWNLEDLLASV
jgi:putative transposase